MTCGTANANSALRFASALEVCCLEFIFAFLLVEDALSKATRGVV